jgi:hypothetical protein
MAVEEKQIKRAFALGFAGEHGKNLEMAKSHADRYFTETYAYADGANARPDGKTQGEVRPTAQKGANGTATPDDSDRVS